MSGWSQQGMKDLKGGLLAIFQKIHCQWNSTIISQYEFISNEKRDTEVIVTVEKVRKRPRKGDEEGVEKV